ncbi:Cell division protein FtsH [Minicystis rosea]|nr:Cell division protein FtsH [Minicystis rosea]
MMNRITVAGVFGLTLSLGVVAITPSCTDDHHFSSPPQGGSGGSSPSGSSTSTGAQCVDGDGDGYGPGCAAGLDCDDTDPAITNQCLTCSTPKEGCPCANEGETLACGKVDVILGDQQQHVCGAGVSVCSGGRWGECIINNTVTLVPSSPTPGPKPFNLGGPSNCLTNPCDPNCVTFVDTPTGLSNPDAGVAASDAGITLYPPDASTAPNPTCIGGTLGTCSHSVCSVGAKLTTGCDGTLACVSKVCSTHPTCCSGTWDANCVAWAQSDCNIACGSNGGTCVVCYKDSTDHDGDGYSYAQGDCADCDPLVNPGAYDFPGNGIDEDCNGVPDDAVTSCDTGLALASSVAGDYAKAIDLCKTTTATATGASKTWGVISSKLVQADGASTPNSLGYGILSAYGPNNLPQKGAKMAAFSSGTARSPADANWYNPNGQGSSTKGYLHGTSCSYPSGFPKNKTGCAKATGNALDSAGLLMSIRVPTNARSFTYRFDFFTSEYPEYICNQYNDSYVALLKTTYTPANPAANSLNISFDSNSNPVNVNMGLFSVTSGPLLQGTGLDGTCKNPDTNKNEICGGATGWLQTSAPVVPGETIQIQFSIWDASDEKWDSTVLVDAWNWSGDSATITTGQAPPPPPPALYGDGYFVRDYDMTGVCPADSVPFWGLWSWNSVTPSDSKISFSVQTADTAAGLATAPMDDLLFSNPPGPTALAGTSVVAKTGSPSTNAGSAVVDSTLLAKSRSRIKNFLRVTSHLIPSTDNLSAPVLSAWNLQVSCVYAL